MYTLFRLGGYPMYFVMLFGLAALATAFWYATRPNPRLEGFIRWMMAATAFSVIAGTCAAFAAVMNAAVQMELTGERRVLLICEGLAETMSAGIMGFAMLSLVALMMAVGKRRLDARG